MSVVRQAMTTAKAASGDPNLSSRRRSVARDLAPVFEYVTPEDVTAEAAALGVMKQTGVGVGEEPPAAK